MYFLCFDMNRIIFANWSLCTFILELLAGHTNTDMGNVPFEYLMKLFCWLAISLGSFLRGEGPIIIFCC